MHLDAQLRRKNSLHCVAQVGQEASKGPLHTGNRNGGVQQSLLNLGESLILIGQIKKVTFYVQYLTIIILYTSCFTREKSRVKASLLVAR